MFLFFGFKPPPKFSRFFLRQNGFSPDSQFWLLSVAQNYFWQTNRLWTGFILKLTTVASLQAKKRVPKGTLSVFIGHHKPKIVKNGGNKLIATFPFFAKQRSVNWPYLSIQTTQKDGSKHSEILRERALQLFSLEFSKNTLNIFISYLLNRKTSIEHLKFNPFAVRNLHF